MTLFIISVAAIIIWKLWQRRDPHRGQHKGLGPILGHATHFAECPMCGTEDSQAPRGRGEVIIRGGAYVVRQYFICTSCDTRALWHRRIDMFIWTTNRSGTDGIPWNPYG